MVVSHAGSFSVRRWRWGGYTLLEMLVTVLIIQVIAAMVVVNASDVEGSERVARAAQETIIALRYARMTAMASGQPAGVEFSPSMGQVRVITGSGAAADTVTNPLLPGGAKNYVLNLASTSNIAGVKITAVNLANVPAAPYQCIYNSLGGTANNGYVTFKYGRTSRTVNIPLAGDARMQ